MKILRCDGGRKIIYIGRGSGTSSAVFARSPKLPNSVWQSRKKIEKQLFCVTFLGLRIAVLGVHPSKVLVTWKPIHAIAG